MSTWMNTYDIDEAVERFQNRPVLGKAARLLAEFRDEVNAHSDGWAYWQAPSKAAGRLIDLLQKHLDARFSHTPLPEPTEDEVRRTLAPIKAFYTRLGNKAGMKPVTLEPTPDLLTTITDGDWDRDALDTCERTLNQRCERYAKITLRERGQNETNAGALDVWASKRIPQDLMLYVVHFTEGFVNGFSVLAQRL
jgi:hypothetical protein